ncbi:MAG: hypothetical protein H0V96_01245 [Acidimicrobiia bacterium]|nr:hypothetical protein [Acidimicrobiia bacterium]
MGRLPNVNVSGPSKTTSPITASLENVRTINTSAYMIIGGSHATADTVASKT